MNSSKIIQTQTKPFSLSPPDIRLWELPTDNVIATLITQNEREHLKQLVEQYTDSTFTHKQLDAVNKIVSASMAQLKLNAKQESEDTWQSATVLPADEADNPIELLVDIGHKRLVAYFNVSCIDESYSFIDADENDISHLVKRWKFINLE